MSDYVQVYTTTETREDAGKIAKDIVAKRLAACAQIQGPVESIFWWEGSLNTAEEWVLVMKTRKDLLKDLELRIQELHPYEVPEIIASSISGGNSDYFRLLDSETGK